MYRSKFRTLVPLTCVSPDLNVCVGDRPILKPQPPPQRRELARLNTITIREKATISSRPQSVKLPPIFGTGLCPHPPAQRKTKTTQSEEEDSNRVPRDLKNTGHLHDNISLTSFKGIERAHQSFDKAIMHKNLAEKVTEHRINHEVNKGYVQGFLEARRIEASLRYDREMWDMEKALTRQRAKREQEVQHARQKNAQFLEEKKKRIQEREKVACFSRQHISLAKVALRFNTWERRNQLSS
ncbi:uncharacterized protein [Pseudorasbora parva]|uniref:uncharacterized protein n=1 Tax=Pseudorasbora parva TaxID=51549 RepID=UPI00351E1149